MIAPAAIFDDVWAEIAEDWPEKRAFVPRRWQSEALPLIVDAIRRGEQPVISATMGAGKSVAMSALLRLALRKVGSDGVLVVTAPTEKLVKQLSATVAKVCGKKNVGVYYGKKKQPKRRIIVSCNPSLLNLTTELAAQGRRCKLLVVDECHRSEAAQIKDVVPILKPASLVGFTATPFRSATSESLSLYSDIVYRYTWEDGKRDGVLVDMREVWDHDASRHETLDHQCLTLIRECGATGPGIISAIDIADAEKYAEWLSGQGFAAEAIHSKLSTVDQEDRILRLQHGQLRALVHVSMLSEGIDFPWLRWLCLRRPVGSRTRLVQEVGRGGRADEGKEFFWCIDPHNLLGSIGMHHKPSVGDLMDQVAEEEESRSRSEDSDGSRYKGPLPTGVTVDLSTQWSQRFWFSMLEAGLADPGINDGHWRTFPPNDRQLNAVEKMGRAFARYLPDEHKKVVLAMSRRHVAEQLTRGTVSDLISILKTVADAAPSGGWQARKGWSYPWPEGFSVPPLDPRAVKGLKKVGKDA